MLAIGSFPLKQYLKIIDITLFYIQERKGKINEIIHMCTKDFIFISNSRQFIISHYPRLEITLRNKIINTFFRYTIGKTVLVITNLNSNKGNYFNVP